MLKDKRAVRHIYSGILASRHQLILMRPDHHLQEGGVTMAWHGSEASKDPIRFVKSGRVGKIKAKKNLETKTVIFVPQTANSMLVKLLRANEIHMIKAAG